MQAPAVLQGVIVPVVTPFSMSGEVDSGALTDQLRWLSGRGLAGVVALGSTGEAPLVNCEERRLIYETVARERGEGEVFIAGTGAESTAGAIENARLAAEAGADAQLVITPSYYRAQMNSAALTTCFRALADTSELPIILYNIPQNTGVPIPPAVVETLAAHEKIIGIKDSSGDMSSLQLYLERTPPRFGVITGSALLAGTAALSGACGAILAMANVVPELCVATFAAGRDGRCGEVPGLQVELNHLTRAIQGRFGIPGIKTAASLLGGSGGHPRLPLLAPDESGREEIRAALAEGGLLDPAATGA